MHCHSRQRLTALIAMIAILLGALVPAASQAMSVLGDGTVRWTEVCTATGMQWVAVDADGEQGDGSDSASSMASCPYCCPHAGSFALAPSSASSFVFGSVPAGAPLRFLAAPHPLFAWATSNPRAPPLAS